MEWRFAYSYGFGGEGRLRQSYETQAGLELSSSTFLSAWITLKWHYLAAACWVYTVGPGNQTQDFLRARQALYLLSDILTSVSCLF